MSEKMVEFLDNTIEVDFASSAYVVGYFGKSFAGYSIKITVTPYDEEIYQAWVSWTSQGKSVGTGLDFTMTAEPLTQRLTFNRDNCRVTMAQPWRGRPGSIDFRCNNISKEQFTQALEDFKLLMQVNDGFTQPYPTLEFYIRDTEAK